MLYIQQDWRMTIWCMLGKELKRTTMEPWNLNSQVKAMLLTSWGESNGGIETVEQKQREEKEEGKV